MSHDPLKEVNQPDIEKVLEVADEMARNLIGTPFDRKGLRDEALSDAWPTLSRKWQSIRDHDHYLRRTFSKILRAKLKDARRPWEQPVDRDPDSDVEKEFDPADDVAPERGNRPPSTDPYQIPASEPRPEEVAELSLEIAHLRQGLERLSHDERLLLKTVDGTDSVTAVSRSLGCSPQAVRDRTKRLLVRLRLWMETGEWSIRIGQRTVVDRCGGRRGA